MRLLLQIARVLLVLLGLFFSYYLSLAAGKTGASRLFSMISIINPELEPADTAVRLAPNDPEAHYTRALKLVDLSRLDEAVSELRTATRLRPNYYAEWLDLGLTLDRMGDQAGAMAALRESIRLAPNFAQPRWQLGSLLFRQAQYEEAFSELRLATQSDPGLGRGLLDLAWVAASGDVAQLERLVQPKTRTMAFEMAKMLASQGRVADAASLARRLTKPENDREKSQVNEIISELISKKGFAEAFSVFATAQTAKYENPIDKILNVNFTEPLEQDNGFGWQLTDIPGETVSLDSAGPRVDAKSLRMEFGGDVAFSSPSVHQLVIVQPRKHYLLSFLAKTEDLVSGGPPAVMVFDVTDEKVKLLGQSKPLINSTPEWEQYRIDFVTGEATSAVELGLQRITCAEQPCPIFGKLWLSGFEIKQQ